MWGCLAGHWNSVWDHRFDQTARSWFPGAIPVAHLRTRAPGIYRRPRVRLRVAGRTRGRAMDARALGKEPSARPAVHFLRDIILEPRGLHGDSWHPGRR